MSNETQSQSRKRRDKKRKTEYEGDSHDVSKEDSPSKDDSDGGDDHHDHGHHGPPGGVLSTIVFICLLGGLVVLTSLIYVELKGSKELGPSISESRYASILGDFVDEHPPDDHDHDEHAHCDSDDGHSHAGGGHGDGGDDHGHSEHGDDGHGDDHGEEEEEVGFFQSFTTFESSETHGDDEPASVELEQEDTPQADESLAQESLSESEEELPLEFSEHASAEEERFRESRAEEDTSGLAIEAEDDEHDEQAINEEPTEEQVEELEEQIEEQPEQNDELAEQTEDADGQAESAEEPEEQTEQTDEQSEVPEHVDEQTEEHADPAIESSSAEEGSIPEEEEVAGEEVDYSEEIFEIPTESQSNSIESVETIQVTPVADNREEVVDEEATEVESDSSQPDVDGTDSQTDWASYEQADITNQYDYEIHKELDSAEQEVEKSAENSKNLFEELLERYPESPRAMYGKARSLDVLSEQLKSNSLLEESIYTYRDTLSLPNVPDKLFRLAGSRCAERMRFRGFIGKSTRIYQKLMQKFPEDAGFPNQLAVSYILLGDNLAARTVLQEVLKKFPDDGFAKVHYGFILKTDDSNYEEAIRYLREGIETGEEGTVDGRFYFHLGDALMRQGFPDQAMAVYEDGVKKKLFLSVYQRSLYNVDSLTGRPWWTPEQSTYQANLKRIEEQWRSIREEGLALLDENQEGFLPESEGLKEMGVWKQFELFARGKMLSENCKKAPKTCELIGSIPEAATCKRGQVKFSIMHPGTHVWAHTGPTNCRLRAHLGLVVPEGVRIRVANETRSWKEGEFIIFDDSFEHEVWHDGSGFRLVFIVDLWHPELTEYQRRTLTSI